MHSKLSQKLTNLPTSPGVYLYYNKNRKIIYVGKAKNLRNRVSSYFVNTYKGPKTEKLVSEIYDLEIIQVRSEVEAFLLESELIKRYKPKYNISLKDDKSYKYIAVSEYKLNIEGKNYTFSKISSVFGKKFKDTRYYGPFPDGTLVAIVLRHLRRIFPHCENSKTKMMQSIKTKRACLYAHIGLCSGVCANLKEYSTDRKNVKMLENFLKKGFSKSIEDLEKQMYVASANMEYEKARELRDVLAKINKLETASIMPEQYTQNPNLMVDIYNRRLEEINKLFNLQNVKRIECYDISNIMESWTVGSMTVSENGQLNKKMYRRFKIKYTKGISDFDMLKEVLSRRIKNSWPLPDILLIDGGKGQLTSIQKAVYGTVFEKIPQIGIFKPNDYFIRKINNKWKIIKSEKQNIGFLHLRELRDEAHRFANKYRKKLMEVGFIKNIKKI